MDNYIIIAVLALILGMASGYIFRKKKQGAMCIGCSCGCSCASGGCGGSCGSRNQKK